MNDIISEERARVLCDEMKELGIFRYIKGEKLESEYKVNGGVIEEVELLMNLAQQTIPHETKEIWFCSSVSSLIMQKLNIVNSCVPEDIMEYLVIVGKALLGTTHFKEKHGITWENVRKTMDGKCND